MCIFRWLGAEQKPIRGEAKKGGVDKELHYGELAGGEKISIFAKRLVYIGCEWSSTTESLLTGGGGGQMTHIRSPLLSHKMVACSVKLKARIIISSCCSCHWFTTKTVSDLLHNDCTRGDSCPKAILLISKLGEIEAASDPPNHDRRQQSEEINQGVCIRAGLRVKPQWCLALWSDMQSLF